MIQRVKIEGIEFPRLYIAENSADAEMCKANGIPFIKWRHGMDSLIKMLLRPAIEKLFPGIDWNKVLGKKRRVSSKVIMCPGYEDLNEYEPKHDNDAMLEAQYEYDKNVDELHQMYDLPDDGSEFERDVPIAEDWRDCAGGGHLDYDMIVPDEIPLADYVGDLTSQVNIDVLEKLGMLPKFVGDIVDCIKLNLSNNMRWSEGYTKKLGVTLGNFKSPGVLPNLIILDISASIPDGIAATMITLIDTLREQCNAELIITSLRSGYYAIGTELPKPQTIRDYYGRGNEGVQFQSIIETYIAGREFGHVISFGDYDNPGAFHRYHEIDLSNTKVHAVHHYHTYDKAETGYAKWTSVCNPDEVEYNTSWCNCIKDRYRM